MNIEMFFILAAKQEQVRKEVLLRLQSPVDPPHSQPDWGIKDSYDLLLANDKKRKVALSPAAGGWIAGIESKEILDLALLQTLSVNLSTTVVVVQLYEVVGACGYAKCDGGVLKESYFSEEDANPYGTIKGYLASNNVALPLVTFREAVGLRSSGWVIVSSQ